MADLYYLYGATIGGTLIDGVSDKSMQPNTRIETIGGDGAIDATFVGVGQQAPVIPFTTAALTTALGKVGVSGHALAVPATLFWQKGSESGTRAGAASHLLETINKAYVVPRQIRATQTPPATITYDIITLYNGTNEPVAYTVSQSLTGTALNDEAFVAGPVKINGVTLDAVTDITIDFGLNPETVFANGGIWPLYGGLATRRPSISIGIKDAALLNTYGLDGTAISSTTTAFLRKCAQDGTREAVDAITHISATLASGIITVERFQGSGNTSASGIIRLTPRYNGSNVIVVMATNASIA
jgi:hypothetical protein